MSSYYSDSYGRRDSWRWGEPELNVAAAVAPSARRSFMTTYGEHDERIVPSSMSSSTAAAAAAAAAAERDASSRTFDAAYDRCQWEQQRPHTNNDKTPLVEPTTARCRDNRGEQAPSPTPSSASESSSSEASSSSSSASQSPSPSSPSSKKGRKKKATAGKKGAKKNAANAACGRSVHGRKGDPRMHLALSARLAQPSMPLLDALLQGGFVFTGLGEPGASDRTCRDEDGVLLYQRKNQLNRRIRLANNKAKAKDNKGKKANAPNKVEQRKAASNDGSPSIETEPTTPPLAPAPMPVTRAVSLRRDEAPLLRADFDPPLPRSFASSGRRHSTASLDDVFLALPDELDAKEDLAALAPTLQQGQGQRRRTSWIELERQMLADLDPEEVLPVVSGGGSEMSSGVSLWSGHFHAVPV